MTVGVTALTQREVSLRLQQFEQETDVLRYVYEGWSVWPLLRFQVAQTLLALPHQARPLVDLSRLKILRLAVGDIWAFCFARKPAYLVKSYTFVHTELVGGKFRDVFLDGILDAYPSGFKLEHVNQPESFERLKPRAIASRGQLRLPSRLRRADFSVADWIFLQNYAMRLAL